MDLRKVNNEEKLTICRKYYLGKSSNQGVEGGLPASSLTHNDNAIEALYSIYTIYRKSHLW